MPILYDNLDKQLRHHIRQACANWAYLKDPSGWTKQTMEEYKYKVIDMAETVVASPLFEELFKNDLPPNNYSADFEYFVVIQERVNKILNQIKKKEDIEKDF